MPTRTSSRRCGPGPAGSSSRTSPPAGFVAAIRIVAAGDALLAPAVTRRLLDRFADRLPAGRTTTRTRAARPDRARARGPQAGRPAGCRTARSPTAWSSPSRRSRPTSRTSSTSSSCATGRRRSCSPTRPGWSAPARSRTDAPEGRGPDRLTRRDEPRPIPRDEPATRPLHPRLGRVRAPCDDDRRPPRSEANLGSTRTHRFADHMENHR